MMKRLLLFAPFFLPALLFSRTEKMLRLPEITPHLEQREVMVFSADSSPLSLFSAVPLMPLSSPSVPIVSESSSASGVVVLQGRFPYLISNPVAAPINRPLPVLPGIPSSGIPAGGRYLLLRNAEREGPSLYDMQRHRLLDRRPSRDASRLIGVRGPYAVLAGENRLLIENIEQGDAAAVYPGTIPSFSELHGQPHALRVLSETSLISFYPAGRRFEEIRLPAPPVTDGLFYKYDLIYGSQDRRLIRFSPNRKKTVWAIDLGDSLRFPPLFAQGYFLAVTEGDAVFWIRPNGTIAGWQALGSICRFPPLLMNEHIGLVLQNNEVHFFRIADRSRQKIAMAGPADAPPVWVDRSIYLLVRTNPRESRLVRIGNRIGVDIIMQPEFPTPGRSLLLEARAVNLDQPSFSILIKDEAGTILARKQGRGSNREVLAWIPEGVGRFRIEVEVSSSGGKHSVERPFQVCDWIGWSVSVLRAFRYSHP